MKNSEILDYLDQLKKNVKVYTPLKYFKGLKTKSQVRSRFNEILKRRYSDYSDPKSYKPFPTDKLVKTRESEYTKAFREMYGNGRKNEGIRSKSEKTGIPYRILKKVYDKGLAAWRTGHRPGASPQAWGHARINSFATLGCTVFSADFSLFKEATEEMKKSAKGRKALKKIVSGKIRCDKIQHYKTGKKALKLIRDLKKQLN
jgi:hypothetical protein